MRVVITGSLVAALVFGCAAAADARDTGPHPLGKSLSATEKQAYSCGWWRHGRPVRAYVTRPGDWYRLMPRNLLVTRRHVVLRCAYRLPRPVPAAADPLPAAAPPAAIPPAPSVAPLPAPTPPASYCRNEIGDPTTPPATTGLRPVANNFDAWDPSPELRQADQDPMVNWNSGNSHVTDDGHVTVTFPDGVAYPHPVGSLQFALASLRQYRLTADRVWLDRALTAANDTLSTAAPGGQIPQPFPWPGPEGQILQKPAYSALAQADALALATRLYWITGDQKWRDTADLTFNTVATAGTVSPSITFIDTNGYLWFEEFPLECPSRVWNGHVFTVFAIYDYWRLTGSPRALELFDAGATTALHYMPLIRRPGTSANYNVSFQHGTDYHYHRMMTNQLYYLGKITGDASFTSWADLLYADLH